jgi:hypothetical protein
MSGAKGERLLSTMIAINNNLNRYGFDKLTTSGFSLPLTLSS